MSASTVRFALCLGLSLLGPTLTQATLTSSYQFNGKGNWSLDAVGGNTSPVGNVQAFVPVGSTVVKAFLYTSLWDGAASVPNLSLAGVSYSGAAWTALGPNVSASYLQAYRADVTAQIQAAIGGGSASLFDFSVTETSNTLGTDGEVLAIIYSNPLESERTIAFLDGSSASDGDSTTINFSTALSGVGDPGFEALVSLGIGFGHQPNGQYSVVQGNGRTLTSSAGGEDDGVPDNGALITVGGLGDSSANPNPTVFDSGGPRTDDELYDLGQGNSVNSAPFLSNGLTSYTFNTNNPSDNDNIFFLGVNITARAGVNQPPPPATPGVPDSGSTAGLAALGIIALAAWKRATKSA